MSTRDVTLRWDDTNMIEDGYNIYRSISPMDINNMPAPIATLNLNSTTYYDEITLDEQTRYYRVSSYNDTLKQELFSDEYILQPLTEFLYVYVYAASGGKIYRYTLDGYYSYVDVTNYNYGEFLFNYDDTVYTSYAGNIVKLESHLNSEIWTYDTQGYIREFKNDVFGNVILTYKQSSGNIALMKLDTDKNVVYWIDYGNQNGSSTKFDIDDQGNCYYLSGYRGNYLNKIDPNGNTIFGFTVEFGDPVMVAVDSNQNIYVRCDDDNSGYELRKYRSSDGREVWDRSYLSRYHTYTFDNDDNIIVMYDNTIEKFDINGSTIWKKEHYNVSISANRMVQTRNGEDLIIQDALNNNTRLMIISIESGDITGYIENSVFTNVKTVTTNRKT